MMPEFPRGECRSCGSPVSCFALSCPNCRAPNQPNPVATIAALLAVALIGAAIAIAVRSLHHGEARQTTPSAADSSAASDPGDATADDYGWIVKAMAECEEEAKQNSGALHFLIVPVASTGLSLPGWSPNPIADIGSSAKLLSSSDALIGLRNRALALYAKPVTFAVSDSKSKTVYKWKPAVGVAALNTKDSSLEDLKLGFEIPDVADEIEWGPTLGFNKGTCYWINPLIVAPSRSR
jgi:hypothetical protein